jgi:hypothetical protein
VLKHNTLPWNWLSLSEYMVISIDEVKTHLYLPWEWGGLTRNDSITCAQIMSNLHLPWQLSNLAHKNDMCAYMLAITDPIDTLLEDIKSHILWEHISCMPTTTVDIIREYPDLPWNWRGLSHNKNMTFEFIESIIEGPWDWKAMSRNSFKK